ncbi:hypothetical protein Aple_066040 [Acrocarpospora pleiomorpha]|uniref:Uncharacterized protein n=1 Tax=Acrocarpospora pleiomorpha TaxID=90975 RepID=A0A5M3XQW9_9ACTN|nr:GerMN domain-containing protein [Acrocarpospora pleiomorpha]GES23705.1 hypothetical protein Aple_066040 [Acrocarpospora pleiomorpha]
MHMLSLRAFVAGVVVGAVVGGGLAIPASARAATPILVAIRAAHHPGLDRLVFEFKGALPAERSARYVTGLVADGSGLPVPVVGSARLLVRFGGATGHADDGNLSYGAARRTYALPGIIQVVNTGDFEAVLTFGVGVAKKTPFQLYTLKNPSRVVIELTTPYRTVNVKSYFLNSANFNVGRKPYTKGAVRPVVATGAATGALQRLFAGPTQGERVGLHFVDSKATGFSKVTIENKVARVYLTGGCSSGGSTFTIADEIVPTLKQFSSVQWVKIYDPVGRTQRPTGSSDSIPVCLEP